MKIYTKTGDKGETRLFNNECVSKGSLRVEAYGGTDELNAMIGFVRAQELPTDADQMLDRIQNELFVLGSDLATPMDSPAPRKIDRIGEGHIAALEKDIDRIETTLPKLTSFILPGGSEAGALLHVARTVCRRGERLIVRLAREENIRLYPVKYTNRLSDFLFVLARYVNHEARVTEMTWKPLK